MVRFLFFLGLYFSFNLLAIQERIYVISSEHKDSISLYVKDKLSQHNLTLSYCNPLKSGQYHYYPTHQAAWEDIAKNGYSTVIIFEDNIEFHEKFEQNLSTIMNNIPKDTDIFFLDIGMQKPSSKKTYFVEPEFWLTNFKNTDSPYYAKIKSSFKQSSPTLCGLHAYCINSKTAKKLLNMNYSLSTTLDTTIFQNVHLLNMYVSKIKLISGNELNYKNKTKNSKLKQTKKENKNNKN